MPRLQRPFRRIRAGLMPCVRLGTLLLCGLLPLGAQAAELARQLMPTPLAPGGEDHLTLPMPANLDPSEEVWVAYRMYAISANPDPSGDIVVSGSFDGVKTPLGDMTVVFTPSRMEKTASQGTIGQKFEAAYGKRSDAELATVMGPGLFEAYTALNRKSGAILQGTVLKTLPPPGADRPPLLVTVERESDQNPVGLEVIVGQGDLPADVQAAVDPKPAFRIGKMLVLGLVIAIVVGVWLRLRND
ncbi:MAG: hypothetical protein ACTHOH_01660 [Lysobacteraceae bacterium]